MPLTGRPGLAATHVIPHGWEQHHRPVSEDGMEAVCRIERPSSTRVWDDVAGRDVFPAPGLVYEGRCRFHRGGPPSGGDAAGNVVADRQVALAQYTVTIPTGTDLVRVNDVVTITECEGDPDSVGKPMQVLGARRSAKTWERTISVQMQQPTTN
jgi:hypothetical protein